MTKEQTYNAALVYLANTEINIYLIDALRATNYGNNKKRKKYKSIQDDNIEIINKLHEDLDTERQMVVSNVVKAVEIFVSAVTSSELSLDFMTSLMKEYKKGNIKIEGDV